MINWLHYLLEVNIYLTAAYSCYWLLFRKETFYKANRTYLLASTVVCFIIPLIQIGALHPAERMARQAFVVIQNSQAKVKPSGPIDDTPVMTLNKALIGVYFTGMASMVVLLVTKLYSLLKSVFSNPKIRRESYWLIHIDNCTTPYSFLHYLFTNTKEPLSPIVLKHELTHIRQKHSWDILLLEVVKIVCWFNPAVYLIQHSLRTLHEFLADVHTVHNSTPTDQYVEYLIANAHHAAPAKLTNNFSEYKLLKNRIIMLYQKPSGKLARLKYLAAAPVCAALLCSSTLAFSKTYGWIKIEMDGHKKSNLAYRTVTLPTKNQQVLLVKFANVITLTQQLEVRHGYGTNQIYTAATLNNDNQTELLKKEKIAVSIVENSLVDKNHPLAPTMIISTGIAFKPVIMSKGYTEKISIPDLPLKEAFTPANIDKQAMLEPMKSKNTLQEDTSSLESFYKQMGRTIRYPAAALKARIGGQLTALIKTDNSGKISDAYISKGVSEDIDKEVLRAIKSYQEKLPDASTYYSLSVTVALVNAKGNQLPFKSGMVSNSKSDLPKPRHVKQLSEVVVIGYIN